MKNTALSQDERQILFWVIVWVGHRNLKLERTFIKIMAIRVMMVNFYSFSLFLPVSSTSTNINTMSFDNQSISLSLPINFLISAQ